MMTPNKSTYISGLVLLLGVFLATTILLYIQETHIDRLGHIANNAAETKKRDVLNRFAAETQSIDSIERFYRASDNVSEKELFVFVESQLERKEFKAVCWHSLDGKSSFSIPTGNPYCSEFDFFELDKVLISHRRLLLISKLVQSNLKQKGYVSLVFSLNREFIRQTTDTISSDSFVVHQKSNDKIYNISEQPLLKTFKDLRFMESSDHRTKVIPILELSDFRILYLYLDPSNRPGLLLSVPEISLVIAVLVIFLSCSSILKIILDRNMEVEHLVKKRTNELSKTVDELTESKKAAEQANIAKTDFLANMSHELRTPLNAVIGFGSLIEEDARLAKNHVLSEDAGRIVSSGEHLLALINDLLDSAKIESGTLSYTYKLVNLVEALDHLLSEAEVLAKKKNNRFSFHFSPDLPQVEIDSIRLHQVLLNLISNASKFTRSGDIHLEASAMTTNKLKPLLVLKVRDSGIGIASEHYEKIFERFAQVHDVTLESLSGTGLGLPLSKSIVEAMGGSISVSSKIGKGTEFVVKIPLLQPQPRKGELTKESSELEILKADKNKER